MSFMSLATNIDKPCESSQQPQRSCHLVHEHSPLQTESTNFGDTAPEIVDDIQEPGHTSCGSHIANQVLKDTAPVTVNDYHKTNHAVN
jgi:hypothetical protein